MAEFELTRTIRRPVADVFAFTSDSRNAPRWQSGIVSLEVLPDAPAQRGTVVMERRRVQGHEIDLSYKVVDFDPPRLIGLEATGGSVGYSARQEFTETEHGATRLRFQLNVELSGRMRMLTALVAPAIRNQAASDLDRLAELLERQTVGESRSLG